jgi:ferredoxin
VHLSVDKLRCAGSAFCVRIAPELFELDAEGLASPISDGDVPPELEEAAEDAANACPTTAVVIER